MEENKEIKTAEKPEEKEYKMRALEEEAEEYSRSAVRRKKRMIRVFVWIIASVALLALLSVGLKHCAGSLADGRLIYSYDPLSEDHGSVFFDRDIEHNIFNDDNYKDQVLRLEFNKNGVSDSIDIFDPHTSDPQSLMFCDYFKAAINGDGKTLNTLFTADYFENNGRPIKLYADKFRMQKIYGMNVTHVQTVTSVGTLEGTYTVERYSVEFYLLENTGDFRPDLPEPEDHTTIPLVFEVITVDDLSYINRIYLMAEG